MQMTPAPSLCPADEVAPDAAMLVPLTPGEMALYDFLRMTRRELAAERTAALGFRVPLFAVLTNATLREVARLRPLDLVALARIRGIGPAKLATYGDQILDTLDRRTASLCLCRLDEEAVSAARARGAKAPPTQRGPARDTRAEAFAAFAAGAQLTDVCRVTGRRPGTIERYLEEFIAATGVTRPEPWVDSVTFDRVVSAAQVVPGPPMKPLFEALGGAIPYVAIRVALAVERERQAAFASAA